MDLVETHAAWVVLAGDCAFKLKKPVQTSYLDFREAQVRRRMLAREAALAADMSPWLGASLHAITLEPAGAAFDGSGPILDWVLKMRRFPAAALLSSPHAAPLDAELALRLAEAVWRVHARAPVIEGADGGETVARILALNQAEQRRLGTARLSAEAVDQLAAESAAALDRARPVLQSRSSAGWVRRCHGDLHLGNIFVIEGEPQLFDALEFDESLAEIDVLYDAAFLTMDLEARGHAALSRVFLERYLDLHQAAAGALALDGLQAFPLFCSMRAAIRAEAAAARGEDLAAQSYLDLAARYLRPRRPGLFAIGGFSGAGKSSLARRYAEWLAPSPGALVIRSDRVRKRLAGVSPCSRLPQASYDSQSAGRAYAACLDDATRAIAGGYSVILDAAFLRSEERAAAEETAKRLGAPFVGLWLDAPLEVRLKRIEGRRSDVSDADCAVARAQAQIDPGLIAWARIDAAEDPLPQALEVARRSGLIRADHSL